MYELLALIMNDNIKWRLKKEKNYSGSEIFDNGVVFPVDK